jgi:hypothetical protein
MQSVGIAGLHATLKGLRHGLGIEAVVSNVALNVAQKRLRHPISPPPRSMPMP